MALRVMLLPPRKTWDWDENFDLVTFWTWYLQEVHNAYSITRYWSLRRKRGRCLSRKAAGCEVTPGEIHTFLKALILEVADHSRPSKISPPSITPRSTAPRAEEQKNSYRVSQNAHHPTEFGSRSWMTTRIQRLTTKNDKEIRGNAQVTISNGIRAELAKLCNYNEVDRIPAAYLYSTP